MQEIYCSAKKSTEYPEWLYYINHISYKIEVRYWRFSVSVCTFNEMCSMNLQDIS